MLVNPRRFSILQLHYPPNHFSFASQSPIELALHCLLSYYPHRDHVRTNADPRLLQQASTQSTFAPFGLFVFVDDKH